MARTKPQKILRLRVQQNGTVNELFVERGKALTIGADAENDVVLYSTALRPRQPLVVPGKSAYRIVVPKGAEGEVRAGDSVLRLSDLVTHGLLPRREEGYLLPVWDGKSGAFELDGVRVEFDFVPPPEDLESLPDYTWRRALLKSLTAEPLLKLLFIVLLTVNLVAVGKLKSLDLPEQKPVDLEKVPERLAKFIVRQKQPQAIATTAAAGSESGSQQQKKQSTGAEKKKSQQEQGKTQQKQGGAQAVMRQGILGLIGGTGESASSSSVVDFLVDKGVVKELDQVLSEGTDLRVGRANGKSKEGSLDDLFALSDQLDVGDAVGDAGSDIADVKLKKEGQVQVDEVGDVKGSAGALGHRSTQQLHAVVAANRGRLEYIYNKYLRRNPDLAGQIELEITIEADGSVSNVRVLKSTVNEPGFVNEILNMVRRWKFPPIPEGRVIAVYPMVFYRVN